MICLLSVPIYERIKKKCLRMCVQTCLAAFVIFSFGWMIWVNLGKVVKVKGRLLLACASSASSASSAELWLSAPCVCQKQRACQAAISLGQTVISKHKNLRYYSSKVTQITSQMFYEVMFDDGSFSNDTYPEDIVVRMSSRSRGSPPSWPRSQQILKPFHY